MDSGDGSSVPYTVQRVLDLLSHLPWPDYVCLVFGFSDHTDDFETEAFYLTRDKTSQTFRDPDSWLCPPY